VPCILSSTYYPTPAICNGDASGIIEFSVENGTPPFSYTWQDLSGGYNGLGIINSIGELIIIENIPSGIYVINIQDQNGNNEIIITEIVDYPITEIIFSASDYNGFNVSCASSNDGSLEALITDVVGSETYLWNTGQSSNPINQLQAGIYSVTIVDQFGCTSEGSYELTAPPILELSTSHEDPFCNDPESGIITILQTNGGVPDYSYNLNGGDYTIDQVFGGLPAGSYTVQIIDANGCTAETIEIIISPEIPLVELGDGYEIFLGDLITLNPSVNNINIQDIIWETIETLDCYNCLEPLAIPMQSAYYTLTIISEDGCLVSDSIFIEVNKPRNIFAPNTFSPNFNGTNDFFTLFGGLDVAMIKKLSVFNRWGAVVFETKNIEAGKVELGWNGTFKGQKLDPDVFVWTAEVAFIDNAILPFSGSITLIR
jgi:gliding motility-associated-like protein